MRRRYIKGRCEDCGQYRNVSLARWWVNDFRMVLCADCIGEYRPRLLKWGEGDMALLRGGA